MKLTTKKNAITFVIVSAIVLVIGILLIPVVAIPATVIITLATPTFIYSLYNLVNVIRAEKEDEEYEEYEEDEEYEEYEEDEETDRVRTVSEKKCNWRDIVRVVTLIGVVVIIIFLIKSCGGQKNQVVEKQTVINQEVINSSMEKVDVENAKIENATVENAEIVDASIEHAAISDADIGEADIGNAVMDNANIENANIENADIESATVGSTICNPEPVKPVEVPKVETPKVETPKVETPKAEPVVHVCAVANTVVEKATCTKDGYTREVCSCGKVLSEKAIKAIGHNWDDGKVTKKATEKVTGKKTYACKTCGETKSEVIEKLAHVCEVADTVVVDATCTKNGYTREVCSCGEVLSEDTIKATGHDWNKGKVTKEPTEKTTGKKTYTCKICGETKTEKIDKLEHECEVCDVIEKEATCTKAGYIRKVCSCGEIISEKTVKATGHDYEIASEKEPTATVDGYTKYRCSNCGDTYKDVIPATGEVEEPVDDEFVITVNKMKVVGNEFDAIEVYTSGNANDLVVLQNQKVFNYTVKDSHHLILTVGDVDTFAKVRIYDPAHEDKVVEVRRLSPVDPMA